MKRPSACLSRMFSYTVLCASAWSCSALVDSGGDGDGGAGGNMAGASSEGSGGDSHSSGGTQSSTGGGQTTGGTSSSGGSNMGSGGIPGSGGDMGDGGTTGSGGVPGVGGMDGTGAAPGSGGSGPSVPESPGCDAVADWPSDWAAREEEILEAVNAVRASGTTCGGQTRGPVDPLTMDPHLRCAARLHSMDMGERDYFSHGTWDPSASECTNNNQCSSGYICSAEFPQSMPSRCGKGPALRVQEIGGPSGASWENIAAGNSTAATTMNQWLNSSGHCNNIMNGSLKTIGIGYAHEGSSSYRDYWTQVFDN